ncbi:MAG: hypothetical protein GY765_18925 [bacterium]|nr:hypothetical protein [bacterium]
MFGLMQLHKCSTAEEEKNEFKLHYCGVCKTTGTLYKQRSRIPVNYDIAFLAELLSGWSGDITNSNAMDTAFYSGNCMKMPNKNGKRIRSTGAGTPCSPLSGLDGIPLSFSVASAVNVLLTELTLRDKTADSESAKRMPWKWAASFMKNQFTAARKQLLEWQFPVESISDHADQQLVREKDWKSLPNISAEPVLEYVSKPTAKITGMVFQNAARLLCDVRGNEKSTAVKKKNLQAMFTLGFHFGRIVYLLDALEDFAKDYKHSSFNAAAAAYGIWDGELTDDAQKGVAEMLRDSEKKIIRCLDKLDLRKKKADIFSKRLSFNLHKRLQAVGKQNGLSLKMDCRKWENYGGGTPRIPGRLVPIPVRTGGSRRSGRKGMMHFANRLARSKPARIVHASLFVMALPVMAGFGYLSFSVPTPPGAGPKKASPCGVDCCICDSCCCECSCEICDSCDCCDGCDCCPCDC